MNKEYWIKHLDLTPHIEGGYFKEYIESSDTLHHRPLYTSIYFLLDTISPSHLHRLTADEVWYYHEGNPLTIHVIDENNHYYTIKLGKDIENGEVLQAVVPKNSIFGSEVNEGYALVSCMVAPGFTYEDFELLSRETLLKTYPDLSSMILRLTREENL